MMMMMMMMVHPCLTPADGHTRSKRERGKKRISLRGRFHPAPLFYHGSVPRELPKEYPLSSIQKYYLSGRPQKANISRPSIYITYPTPTPSISTQRRRPKNHYHQRSIDSRPKAYLPSTSPIKIQPNPTQIMLPSLPLSLIFLLLPSLLTTAQKLPLDSTSHNHIQITLRPYKSNSCTNPSRRGSGKSHSITLKANHRADISSSSGIKIGEITHSKCVGFPRGGFNSFVFDGEGLYGIADGNGEGEGNGEGGVVKVKERMGRCRVDVFPNRLCLGDVMGGIGEVGFLFFFLFLLFVRSND